MGSSDSSTSREKKRKKKEKKEGKKKKDDNQKEKKKHKKESPPRDASRSRSRMRGRDRNRDAPPGANFAPSGLLDTRDGMPPPRGRLERPRSRDHEMAPPRGRLERSRSRDDEPPPPRAPWEPSGILNGESNGGGKGKGKGKDGDGETQAPKEEPNFEASGLLAMEDNSKNGVALNFTLPPDARKPTKKWRLYIFTKAKGNEAEKIVHIHRQAGYLFGKDRRVADIPTDHQTCSKQHAVLHFRMSPAGDVKPYIMDLESKNGTFLNGSRIDSARYVELKEGDMLKFAMSSREYVLLHGGSANHIKIDPSQLRSDSE